MTSARKKQKTAWRSYFTGAFVTISVIIVIFLICIWNGAFGPVPGTGELAKIRNNTASQVYSADGVLLGTYYLQNRTEIPLEEVSPVTIDALLAIEDIRFYQHNGIDYRALLRVLVKSLLLGNDAGGGSTITQQLAKNLYPRQREGWFYLAADKIREMIIARRLEKVYSKDEILRYYFNTVSFGEEIYGIDMAARRFFSKRASDLELHEAATLTGMLRATSWYNPQRNPESALQRRNVVIRQMEKYEMISPDEADRFTELPIGTRYNRISESDGPAPYFREQIRQEMARILESEPTLDGNDYNLYTDGLVIQTTLDSRIQKAAESAVATQMRSLQTLYNRQKGQSVFAERDDPAVLWAWRQSDHYKQLREDGFTDEEIEKILYTPAETQVFTWDGYEDRVLSPYDVQRYYLSFLNNGFLAIDPANGDILAWVGGINHRHYKYDHVKARRQPGSSFKPVVYSAALESGIEPCDYQRNVLSVYEEYEDWTPRNVRDEYGGRYSVQGALAQSINTIAVDILLDTGFPRIQQTASLMGIESPVPAEPSVALGTAEVSLFELVTAYSSFLNSGIPATPRMITAVYNSEGDLIYDFSKEGNAAEDKRPAFSQNTAGAMVQMLSKAVNEGTGQSLRSRFGIRHALAGKTGTTQNYTDGWFVGMTPDMVFGTWVGGSTQRVRLSGTLGYASRTALPVAGYFLNNLQNNPSIAPQKNRFEPHQIQTAYDMSCTDYRDDRFRDRLKDFFTGRDAGEPRVVEEKDEKSRNIFQRIGSIFSKDRDE